MQAGAPPACQRSTGANVELRVCHGPATVRLPAPCLLPRSPCWPVVPSLSHGGPATRRRNECRHRGRATGAATSREPAPRLRRHAARRGEICAVIGPNCAGKTSLFNTLSGFYKPQQGTVRLEGQDITRHNADKRAAMGMACTFQRGARRWGAAPRDRPSAAWPSTNACASWSRRRWTA